MKNNKASEILTENFLLKTYVQEKSNKNAKKKCKAGETIKMKVSDLMYLNKPFMCKIPLKNVSMQTLKI